jgi:hypothetical protein
MTISTSHSSIGQEIQQFTMMVQSNFMSLLENDREDGLFHQLVNLLIKGSNKLPHENLKFIAVETFKEKNLETNRDASWMLGANCHVNRIP